MFVRKHMCSENGNSGIFSMECILGAVRVFAAVRARVLGSGGRMCALLLSL